MTLQSGIETLPGLLAYREATRVMSIKKLPLLLWIERQIWLSSC